VDAFPNDSAPSYLLRDRDPVYGHAFRHRVKGMGLREMRTARSCRFPKSAVFIIATSGRLPDRPAGLPPLICDFS
jgi:hypothetical protein